MAGNRIKGNVKRPSQSYFILELNPSKDSAHALLVFDR